jgi:hypothetical protein
MKQIKIIVALLACGFFVVAGYAETVPSEAEIVALIDQLVSPNSPPDIHPPEAKYPKGFDRVAQRRVSVAFVELGKLGLSAFPFLHARLGDKRYCFTRDAGPSDENFSVGHVCRLIIDGHLQPYDHYTKGANADPRTRPRRPYYFSRHDLEGSKAFASWWKTHKDKPMREIQIEVLEWTIAQEKQKPEDYSAEELQNLNTLLTTLRNSQNPLPPHFPFAK